MHKLTVQLDNKDAKSRLSKIAASLGFIKDRGKGAGREGSISAMMQALIRGELVVTGPKVEPAPKPDDAWYAERAKARCAIAYAVRHGKMPRISTQACAECNAPARQYHHPDYSKPLDVAPLCNRCHGLKHRKDDKAQP